MKRTVEDPSKRLFELMGNAILLASIQASIGSVEQSSKYSVINFSKDQKTLQGAADALTGYLFIGTIWMIGAVFISYGQHGWAGFWASLISNFVIMGWIVLSYIQAFHICVKRYGLKFPKILRLSFD